MEISRVPTFPAIILWVAYFVLRTSIRTLAVGPDEAGFKTLRGGISSNCGKRTLGSAAAGS